ncbi:MAG: Lrp/AsnC family transcriptional regulator [Gammaproteobacteria bacterium]|nr:Lrp/AsnC family transcriptional regulator [Gammaproteobacteria bacterium]
MATPAFRLPFDGKTKADPKRVKLNDLERQLLNQYQKGFPISPTPFADIAKQLGTSEALVLQILKHLQDQGVVSRVGPVFKPKSVGVSTLAAMAVPAEKLDQVAAKISGYNEVNHNYEREHHFNLWFVVTAPDQERLDAVLSDMERTTGQAVLNLPLENQFHIDLGFPLWC